MAVSYNKLWKLLIDNQMKKGDLFRAAEISGYTAAKLNKNGDGSKWAASNFGCGPKLLTLAATQVHAPPQNLRRKTKKKARPQLITF